MKNKKNKNKNNLNKNSVEQKVKEMYNEYVYPAYDKKWDIKAPIPSAFAPNGFLEQINYYNYNGSNDFNNFSILVAGVGLGTDIIALNYQLKQRKCKNTRLLGIDLSISSLEICKKRLELYNYSDDIELINMSLLDLNPEKHGKFDLIFCIGVLHHLEDPKLGLQSLNNVLKDDGMMNIMVYGKYGRTGVYQMQDLMKIINKNTDKMDEKIINYKNIYKSLPSTNWFKKNEPSINYDDMNTDEGIVDLILHVQDRAYSVEELYQWVEGCDLKILSFSPYFRYIYEFEIPEIKMPNEKREKYAINELYSGNIGMHSFYVSKYDVQKVSCDDLNNIPIFCLISKEGLNSIIKLLKENIGKEITVSLSGLSYKLADNSFWNANLPNVKFLFKCTDINITILENINNFNSINKIFNITREKLNIKKSNKYLLIYFKDIFKQFELYDLILLKK